jgi:formate/nitrite transporter FocA (FNT family)
MPNEQLITFIAEKLHEGEKPERIAKMIRGMSADQSKELVQTVHRAMKWNVRKQAFWKMLGSAVLLAIFGGVFLATGRLFFIILPFAAAGFLWGAIQFVFALGYDAD